MKTKFPDGEEQNRFIEKWIYPIAMFDFGKIGKNLRDKKQERHYKQLEKAGVYDSLELLDETGGLPKVMEEIISDIKSAIYGIKTKEITGQDYSKELPPIESIPINPNILKNIRFNLDSENCSKSIYAGRWPENLNTVTNDNTLTKREKIKKYSPLPELVTVK